MVAVDDIDPGGVALYPSWAFSWPANRRIIYNRASADANGKPWNPNRELVEWDEAKREWIRNDVPDFGFSTTAADGTVTHKSCCSVARDARLRPKAFASSRR